MGMSTITRNRKENHVRPIGKCTGCGADATHAHECPTCHVTSLCCIVIKCAFNAESLKMVINDFNDADLFKLHKDANAPGNIRKIADTVIRLSTTYGLRVYDVKRNIVSRLKATCDAAEQETPEKDADMKIKINDWCGAVAAKIRSC